MALIKAKIFLSKKLLIFFIYCSDL